jgi:hypothetical protein
VATRMYNVFIIIARITFEGHQYMKVIRHKKLLKNEGKFLMLDTLTHNRHSMSYIWWCNRTCHLSEVLLKVQPSNLQRANIWKTITEHFLTILLLQLGHCFPTASSRVSLVLFFWPIGKKIHVQAQYCDLCQILPSIVQVRFFSQQTF